MNFGEFINTTLKNKFISGNLWTLIASVIVGSAGLVLQTLITNSYGLDNLGIYTQVVSFYTIFSCISVSGIMSSTLKHAAEYINDRNKLSEIYCSSQILILGWSFFIISSLWIVIRFIPELFSSMSVAENLVFALPGILFFALNKNSNAFICGMREMRLYSIVRIFRWSVLMLFTAILCFGKFSFSFLIQCYSFVEFLLFIFFLLKNRHFIVFKKLDSKWLKIHFHYGIANMVSVLLDTVRSNFMILISGYYLTLAETGIFSILMMFTNVFFLVSTSIQMNFNPIFAKDWAEGKVESIRNKLEKILRITKYSSPLLFIIAVLGYYLYERFFLENHTSTYWYFALMSIGTIFSYILGWTASMVIMSGNIIANMKRNILSFIAQVVFPIALLPFLGFNGAIISYILVQISIVIIGNYYVNHYLDFNIIRIAYGVRF